MPTKFDTSKMPEQRAFFESAERELLYSGAFGAGKSRVGCEKGLWLSLKYPGNVGVVIRKTFVSLRMTTMVTWEKDVCPPGLIENFSKAFNQPPNKCTLTNGSEILFMGLDDPQKIGSLEVGWIFVDEAIELSEDDYIMLLGRLRLTNLVDSYGNRKILPVRQIFSATNPASDTHWLYRRAYEEKEMQVFESNTISNVHTPQDYKESLSKFKGIYYDRYVLGKWVGASGLVYDCYDAKKHKIPNFEIPSHWKRYRGIDFGFTNPFCCLWIAEHPKIDEEVGCVCEAPVHKGFYVYREIYMSQRTVEEHALDIIQANGNEHIVRTYADWAAGDRASLELHGVPTIKAIKDISAGIQTVYNLLANDELHFLEDILVERDSELQDEKGRRKPQSLLDELQVYKYQAIKTTVQAARNEKEDPADKDNHGCDALRYVLHTLALNNNLQTPMVTSYQRSPFETFSTKPWIEEGIFSPDIVAGATRWSGN